MAAVYSNPLNLFNLVAKTVPLGTDLVPIGDTAITGVPLKQCTITQLVTAGGGVTIGRAFAMAYLFGR